MNTLFCWRNMQDFSNLSMDILFCHHAEKLGTNNYAQTGDKAERCKVQVFFGKLQIVLTGHNSIRSKGFCQSPSMLISSLPQFTLFFLPGMSQPSTLSRQVKDHSSARSLLSSSDLLKLPLSPRCPLALVALLCAFCGSVLFMKKNEIPQGGYYYPLTLQNFQSKSER